ncbi:MAG: hypothetical protein WDO69_13440 [Pseudomonadota bacterium]
MPIEELAEQLADAACESIEDCCTSATIPFDLGTCRAIASAYLQKGVDATIQSAVRYDPSAAGACVTAYRRHFKGCVETRIDSSDSCGRMFVGTVELGDTCTGNDDCAPSADGRGHCALDSDQEDAQAVCVAAPSVDLLARGQQGEPCSATCGGDGDCAAGVSAGSEPSTTACFADDGLQCDSDAHICQPLAMLGEACNSAPCVVGAFCTEAKVCATKKPDGAACASDSECAGPRCLFADPNTVNGICGAKSLATPSVCSGNLKD